MARRERQRQLRLFGVGDLGPPDDGDGRAGSGKSDDERWDEVFRDLGRLLSEEKFENYLNRLNRETVRSDGGDC